MQTTDTTTTTHPVVTAATGLFVILQAAELRDLPMPFQARASAHGAAVELQFHTADEVMTWAAALDVGIVDEGVHDHSHGANDWMTATTSWFDVPLTLCCSVPRRAS